MDMKRDLTVLFGQTGHSVRGQKNLIAHPVDIDHYSVGGGYQHISCQGGYHCIFREEEGKKKEETSNSEGHFAKAKLEV